MAGVQKDAFDVDIGAVEGAPGFARGIAEGGFEVARAIDAAHAFASAAGHGFEEDGVAVGSGEIAESIESDGVIGAGDDGCAGGDGRAAGGGLGAHGPDGGG